MKVLVTGATAGFGAAVVRRFSADGHRIVATGRRNDRLEALANEFGPDRVHPVVFDVRDRNAVEAAIGGLPPDFADLDLLVNNAGLGDGGWDDMLAVNLTAAHELCVLAADGLTQRGGAIVNVASVAALVAGPGDPQYAVSKAGLVMLTKSLAVTLGPRGGRANAICPGWVNTDMAWDGLDAFDGLTREEAFEVAMREVPLRRMSEPAEIAATVAWLLSPDSIGVTGQAIDHNNGAFMS
ncbi:MAG TPA: beta-ketoacyl-ACP reductase [Rhizobiales bacterium]|nr:beta-ketoacyl-ACP reductase [Hyphomicrobiales bacterium]